MDMYEVKELWSYIYRNERWQEELTSQCCTQKQTQMETKTKVKS